MNHLLLKLTLVSAFLFIGPAYSDELTKSSLNRLLTYSGISKQLAEMPSYVQSGLDEAAQSQALPAGALDEIKKVIAGAFNLSGMVESVGSEVKRAVNEADAKEILKWYTSDLGVRITKAEEAASTQTAFQEIMSTTPYLMADGAGVEFARKIDALIDGTGTTMLLDERTGIAVFTAMSKAKHPDQPVDLDAFKAHWATQELTARANTEQYFTASLVYAYKRIEPADKEKYAAFLALPATRRFNDSVAAGTKLALDQAIEKLERELSSTLTKPAK